MSGLHEFARNHHILTLIVLAILIFGSGLIFSLWNDRLEKTNPRAYIAMVITVCLLIVVSSTWTVYDDVAHHHFTFGTACKIITLALPEMLFYDKWTKYQRQIRAKDTVIS